MKPLLDPDRLEDAWDPDDDYPWDPDLQWDDDLTDADEEVE